MNRITRIYTDWSEVPVVMTVQQAAVIIGLSADWIKKKAGKGEFPAYRGEGEKTYTVEKSDLKAWLDSRKNNSRPQ